MRVAAGVLVILLAGCAGSPATQHDASAPLLPSADGGMLVPGLYVADDSGLASVDSLPGLQVTPDKDGKGTLFTLDVEQILAANSQERILVQALANLTVQAAYDVDVSYAPQLAPSGDATHAKALCIGTDIVLNDHDHGFYLDRALGKNGTPPAPYPNGGIGTYAMGHGIAGPTNDVIALYGDRFQHEERKTILMSTGEFLRIADHLSQLSPAEVRQPGNHWTQTWHVDGPVRVIRIPDGPLFCAEGFHEFQGGTQAGANPIDITTGSHLQIKTRYGMTINFNQDMPSQQNPGNAASVQFLDKTCQAGPNQGVAHGGFEAGTIRVDVQQWTGDTWIVVGDMPTPLEGGFPGQGESCR